jgi:hypothetical protein
VYGDLLWLFQKKKTHPWLLQLHMQIAIDWWIIRLEGDGLQTVQSPTGKSKPLLLEHLTAEFVFMLIGSLL